MSEQQEEYFLRKAFNAVVKDQEGWRKSSMTMWRKLFDLLNAKDAGCAVEMEVQGLHDEVARLQAEVDRLNAATARQSPRIA